MRKAMKSIQISGLFLALVTPAFADPGLTMRAATTAAPLRVVLTWPERIAAEQPAIRAFQLFRKPALAAAFPDTPIAQTSFPANREDLRRFLNGTQLKALSLALGDPPGPSSKQPVPFDLDQIGVLKGNRKNVKFKRLQMMAEADWQIAVAIGQGYQDLAVQKNQVYSYELRGLTEDGSVVALTPAPVNIVAGIPALASAPTGLNAQPGDSAVLLWWDDVPGFGLYEVWRRPTGGAEVRVNPIALGVRVIKDLTGNPVKPDSGAPGFLDAVVWDEETGKPRQRVVGGNAVDGPANGTAYEYRVRAVDFLGNLGAFCAPSTATPVDKTAPAVPSEILVGARDEINKMEIRFTIVKTDVLNHEEANPAGLAYQVFRYEAPDDPKVGKTAVGNWVASTPRDETVVVMDDAPELRPQYGEKQFWYRVVCRDDAGNVSAYSKAVAGMLRDKTPPAPPAKVSAKGAEESITVSWAPSPEPDVESYQVYRSLCDGGIWVATPPSPDYGPKTPDWATATWTGPSWVLVKTIPHAEVAKAASASAEDRTVPPNSPLCYAYVVKALDHAQNMSGSWPLMQKPFPGETCVCERLKDSTPPNAPIITGLRARDGAVEVEWIGEPVQDIAGYHVYRATEENGTYQFVGGRTVPFPKAKPPIDARDLAAKLPQQEAGCDQIYLETHEGMSLGLFLDHGQVQPLDAKQVYWYKVTGVDQNGIETPQNDPGVVPVSTFTFSTARPQAPTIVSITPASAPPGLTVRWSPAFDPAAHTGFVVLRSRSSAGPFLQVGSVVRDAQEYVDREIARGVDYWYRVVALDRAAKPSVPSASVSGRVE